MESKGRKIKEVEAATMKSRCWSEVRNGTGAKEYSWSCKAKKVRKHVSSRRNEPC